MPLFPEHLLLLRGRAVGAISCMLALIVGGTATGAGFIPHSRAERGIDVNFDAACTSATVSSDSHLSTLVVKFNDGSVERIAELERAASYVLRLAPAAVDAGRSIAALSALGRAHGKSDPAHALTESLFQCTVSAGSAKGSVSSDSS